MGPDGNGQQTKKSLLGCFDWSMMRNQGFGEADAVTRQAPTYIGRRLLMTQILRGRVSDFVAYCLHVLKFYEQPFTVHHPGSFKSYAGRTQPLLTCAFSSMVTGLKLAVLVLKRVYDTSQRWAAGLRLINRFLRNTHLWFGADFRSHRSMGTQTIRRMVHSP